jgi:hypothetical protein
MLLTTRSPTLARKMIRLDMVLSPFMLFLVLYESLLSHEVARFQMPPHVLSHKPFSFWKEEKACSTISFVELDSFVRAVQVPRTAGQTLTRSK